MKRTLGAAQAHPKRRFVIAATVGAVLISSIAWIRHARYEGAL